MRFIQCSETCSRFKKYLWGLSGFLRYLRCPLEHLEAGGAYIRLLAALGAQQGEHLVELIFVPGVHLDLLGRDLQDCHHVVHLVGRFLDAVLKNVPY